MLTPDIDIIRNYSNIYASAADLVEELLPAKIRSRKLGLALEIPLMVVENIHVEFSDQRDQQPLHTNQLYHVFFELRACDVLRTNEVYLPALAELEADYVRQPISMSFEVTVTYVRNSKYIRTAMTDIISCSVNS